MLSHLHNNIDMTIPLYQEPSDLEPIEQIRTQYVLAWCHSRADGLVCVGT